MTPIGSEPLFATTAPGQISHQKEVGQRRYASVRIFAGLATWSNGFFNKIKHCRRVATRYDKLAANYLAFVQLASIRLWLRVNESTS
jgi:transposase